MPSSTSGPSAIFKNSTAVIAVIAVLVVAGAFWLGQSTGRKAGYAQAQADIQALQEESARVAADAAAKSSNPFQAVNPLEGVEANPFEKVKRVLNPFEN